jgi:hypothetical protein
MCFPLLANSDAINELQGEPEKITEAGFWSQPSTPWAPAIFPSADDTEHLFRNADSKNGSQPAQGSFETCDHGSTTGDDQSHRRPDRARECRHRGPNEWLRKRPG